MQDRSRYTKYYLRHTKYYLPRLFLQDPPDSMLGSVFLWRSPRSKVGATRFILVLRPETNGDGHRHWPHARGCVAGWLQLAVRVLLQLPYLVHGCRPPPSPPPRRPHFIGEFYRILQEGNPGQAPGGAVSDRPPRPLLLSLLLGSG